MESKIRSLENQLKTLRVILLALLIPCVLLLLYAFSKPEKKEIIRVKGIIVEDENGKERILIGAPIPYARNRARTDTVKIKEKWAVGMGSDYMKWYRDYDHSSNGIVLLDQNGWDKVVIGDPVPDPIIGKRIGPGTGIVINDAKGLERTGYSVISVDGKLRVVLGLDHSNGTEGAALSVLPDGSVGLYLDSKNNSVFAGSVKPDHWKSPDKKEFTGIIITDSTNHTRTITAGKKK